MATDALTDTQAEILDRGLADVIQIDELADVVRRHLGLPLQPDSDDPRVIEGSLTVIHRLLRSGLMILGDMTIRQDEPSYVTAWPLSADEAVRRVRREWLALGRRINLADIGWLSNTELGRRQAQARRAGQRA